ncbi:MAG: M23 family metallopeptidase [Betaproteobacteria bacterium]|nr:M23 family metallopeptidase [Betaproteobacteria bacterium]
MHIILVSDRMATAKSITLGWRHLFFGFAGFVTLVISMSSLFSYVTVRHAAEVRLPFLQNMLSALNAAETQRSKEFVRENLNAMAIKLGQMQAQLAHLDSLGERLTAMAGIKSTEPNGNSANFSKDRRGGPLVQPSPLSSAELQDALEALSRQIEARSDTLSLIESQMLDERVRKSMLPTTLPVASQWNASSFGWRIDPFTGERALHEGVDFSADVGTPVVAAAGGVVITAERHPEYGNMVEIDHGNDLTTRYAHLSKILVKPGTLVRRGQEIAESGNTGRSTGPHLHFEVRLRGIAQNPNRFLQTAKAGMAVARR